MKKYSSLIITIVILAGGAYYTQQYFIESSANNPAVVATTTSAHSVPTEVATVIIPSSADIRKITSTSSAVQTPNVTFSIPEATYRVYAPPGTTVLETMQVLASTTNFVFSGREYSGMGYFVESINGKVAANGYVWIFYVNGVKSGKGISSVVISEGDTIEWKYEKSY